MRKKKVTILLTFSIPSCIIIVERVIVTSISKFNRKIFAQNLDTVIFNVIAFRVVISLLFLSLIIYIPDTCKFYYLTITIFNLLSILAFVRFLLFIGTLTKASIQSIVEEIDSSDALIKKYKMKIDDIWNECDK